ncbi:MAG: MATE family efflux transporter [Roseburia sp.]|nr:MATE family efflux transporter [Anaeroplasma bactoclasticum]MCM1196914.1 MATE family efflux transporter [Roseburia sp.]MCM1556471.1 MATE family efflux transporter [Anaeroplasma bactoclasticum]
MTKEKALNQKDLTTGSPFKKIFIFSLPLMLSNLLQVLFNMSDVAVVGRFGSKEALGSVGSTTTYVILFTGILIGLGSGVNALIARFLGSKDEARVLRITHTGFLVCLIIGVLLVGLGSALVRPMLVLLNTKPELLEEAVLYVYIVFAGLPALAIYNYGNGILSADGDTKRPLIFLASAGVINIALNLFFVIVCSLSVVGVALASIISQYISAILILIALVRTKRPYQFRFKLLKIYKKETKEILSLGLPAGMQNAIFSMANLFIQFGVNSFDTIMVEGNSAAANVDAFVYDLMAAFYMAIASFIAQNYGAGKKNNILKCYFIGLFYSCFVGLVFGFLFVLFGKPFLSLFTSDKEVVEAGMKRLVVMGCSYFISSFMDATIAALRGLGKTIVPTIILIFGSCVFRIVWVYSVFAYFKTIPSLYLLYPVSWTLTAISVIIYFVIVYRKIFLKNKESLHIKAYR